MCFSLWWNRDTLISHGIYYIYFLRTLRFAAIFLFFFLLDTTVWSTSDYLDAEARIMCVMYERIE